MNNEVIQEPVVLPSQGKGYEEKVKTTFQIRGMNTEDEMMRLNIVANQPYYSISKMMDACVLEKPGVSAYDMHLVDFQAFLMKLRTITYGKQ